VNQIKNQLTDIIVLNEVGIKLVHMGVIFLPQGGIHGIKLRVLLSTAYIPFCLFFHPVSFIYVS